jgi:hypothetical protein
MGLYPSSFKNPDDFLQKAKDPTKSTWITFHADETGRKKRFFFVCMK